MKACDLFFGKRVKRLQEQLDEADRQIDLYRGKYSRAQSIAWYLINHADSWNYGNFVAIARMELSRLETRSACCSGVEVSCDLETLKKCLNVDVEKEVTIPNDE